ncbi:hypothetical protein PRL2021_1662 [Lactobacillus crispatus]|nr:hypothetical protein PRL2021_1662 [Lactobacillus crispatus]
MVKVLIRGISEQKLARIDRIVNQLNPGFKIEVQH